MAHPFHITPPVTGEMADELLEEVHAKHDAAKVAAQMEAAKHLMSQAVVDTLQVRKDASGAGRSTRRESQPPFAAFPEQ